jgi:hypothetical protein
MREGEEVEIVVHTQLRIAPELWNTVKHAAVDEGVSANQMTILLILEALEARRAHSHNVQSPSRKTATAAMIRIFGFMPHLLSLLALPYSRPCRKSSSDFAPSRQPLRDLLCEVLPKADNGYGP